MDGEVRNPFQEIERLLQDPVEDGLFLWKVSESDPLRAAGLRAGDVVVEVGDIRVLGRKEFLEAMQPKGGEGESRVVKAVRPGGKALSVDVPAGTRGLKYSCAVRKGEPGWVERPDYQGAPALDALSEGGEFWFQNGFQDEPAGFQRIRLGRRGELLDVEVVFRLGGGEGQERWTYFTRSRSLHRLDKHLSVVRTAFWKEDDLRPVRTGEVELGEDGYWRGVHRSEAGQDQEVAIRMAAPHLITGYSNPLLALTMPLSSGAGLSFFTTYDGSGEVDGRGRMECLGRREFSGRLGSSEGWCFTWRTYGLVPVEEQELFYIDGGRGWLRIDWGANYGYCWTERMPKESALEKLPEFLKGNLEGE